MAINITLTNLANLQNETTAGGTAATADFSLLIRPMP